MNTKKLLATALISSAILLLTACGGGGSSSSASTPQVEAAKNVAEAESNYKSLSALSFATNSINTSKTSSKLQKNSQKTESANCTNGGTATRTQTDSLTSFTFTSCQEGNTYINGTMSLTTSNDSLNVKFEFNNLTIDDTETKITSTSFISEYNSQEYWSTINGDIQISSKCFTGNFDFETISKIYDAQDGTDNAESGILKMNGATYTFDNPYVTIKVGNEEKTISQSELETEIDSSTNCSE